MILKNISIELRKWIEERSFERDMKLKRFVIAALMFAKSGWKRGNPLKVSAIRQVNESESSDRISEQLKPLSLGEVPDDLIDWIRFKLRSRQTQQAFVIWVLERLHDYEKSGQLKLFPEPLVKRQVPPVIKPFSFIELFAGIGGFRIALESRLGGRCVFSSEWNRFSAQTYERWFGHEPDYVGDIRNVSSSDPNERPDIPDHDILTAGFPCQPFSIAGVSKKNSLGHKHGFDCEKQGNLFYSICEIAKDKAPQAMILENVKNLRSHDKGNTWRTIESELKALRTTNERGEEVGYTVDAQIVDAAHFVPQHRERIFIVCFRTDLVGDDYVFEFPQVPSGAKPRFADILDPSPDGKYILTNHLWKYLKEYKKRHEKKGNGFGFGLMKDLNGVSRTLSARYYKDGSEVLIPHQKSDPCVPGKNRNNPRRLTPVEAAHLMGFRLVKSREHIPVSDTQAYTQFGNAVVPDVVEFVGRHVLKVLKKHAPKKTVSKSNKRTQKSKRKTADTLQLI